MMLPEARRDDEAWVAEKGSRDAEAPAHASREGVEPLIGNLSKVDLVEFLPNVD